MPSRTLDNDIFVQKNLERLVNKYPHQRLIISNGEIFRGDSAVKKARKKFPDVIPMFLPVPGPEEFNHIL